MSTLWSKGTQATDLVEDFTVGNDRILDMRLARYDVIGSKAHIRMLESIGLLSAVPVPTSDGAEYILDGEVYFYLTRRLPGKQMASHSFGEGDGRFVGDPFVAVKCPVCGELYPET